MEITLEMLDQVIKRTGVSYAEAKDALEEADGDVLDAIIYIEKIRDLEFKSQEKCKYESIDELKNWFKDLINKGNVSRIKVSKDGKTIVDVPVNAGIAAGVIAIVIPPIFAFVVIAAVVTKITIEVTKEDGSVEVVNKYVSKTVDDIKDTTSDVVDKVKDTLKNKKIFSNKMSQNKSEIDENTFTYTVNFDEEENK